MSKRNNLYLKSGITLSSMMLYVVLFFVFSSFALAVSSNYNYKTLNEKGNLIVNEEISKLQYNLLMSAKQSEDISVINGKIVFSNNDEYEYNSDKHILYKNGGVLVQDLESFSIIYNQQDILNEFSTGMLDSNKTYVGVNVTFKKYGFEKQAKIFITSSDEEELNDEN